MTETHVLNSADGRVERLVTRLAIRLASCQVSFSPIVLITILNTTAYAKINLACRKLEKRRLEIEGQIKRRKASVASFPATHLDLYSQNNQYLETKSIGMNYLMHESRKR